MNTLEVTGLSKHYGRAPARLRPRRTRFTAVDDVSLTIGEGRTFGLVGESGAGKSTVGRLVLRLIEPDAGSIRLLGRDVAALGRRALRDLRADATMIFQDPYTSLNPRMSIRNAVTEPLIIHDSLSRSERDGRAEAVLARVGLRSAHLDRFPYELSGGQLQRVAIARALITDPRFIVCDEPVAALDVSTQAQVINLLRDIQEERGISYLFISHDLRLVRLIADDVAVMRNGRLVEVGTSSQVFDQPAGQYTRELVAAVPGRSPRERRFTPVS